MSAEFCWPLMDEGPVVRSTMWYSQACLLAALDTLHRGQIWVQEAIQHLGAIAPFLYPYRVVPVFQRGDSSASASTNPQHALVPRPTNTTQPSPAPSPSPSPPQPLAVATKKSSWQPITTTTTTTTIQTKTVIVTLASTSSSSSSSSSPSSSSSRSASKSASVIRSASSTAQRAFHCMSISIRTPRPSADKSQHPRTEERSHRKSGVTVETLDEDPVECSPKARRKRKSKAKHKSQSQSWFDRALQVYTSSKAQAQDSVKSMIHSQSSSSSSSSSSSPSSLSSSTSSSVTSSPLKTSQPISFSQCSTSSSVSLSSVTSSPLKTSQPISSSQCSTSPSVFSSVSSSPLKTEQPISSSQCSSALVSAVPAPVVSESKSSQPQSHNFKPNQNRIPRNRRRKRAARRMLHQIQPQGPSSQSPAQAQSQPQPQPQPKVGLGNMDPLESKHAVDDDVMLENENTETDDQEHDSHKSDSSQESDSKEIDVDVVDWKEEDPPEKPPMRNDDNDDKDVNCKQVVLVNELTPFQRERAVFGTWPIASEAYRRLKPLVHLYPLRTLYNVVSCCSAIMHGLQVLRNARRFHENGIFRHHAQRFLNDVQALADEHKVGFLSGYNLPWIGLWRDDIRNAPSHLTETLDPGDTLKKQPKNTPGYEFMVDTWHFLMMERATDYPSIEYYLHLTQPRDGLDWAKWHPDFWTSHSFLAGTRLMDATDPAVLMSRTTALRRAVVETEMLIYAFIQKLRMTDIPMVSSKDVCWIEIMLINVILLNQLLEDFSDDSWKGVLNLLQQPGAHTMMTATCGPDKKTRCRMCQCRDVESRATTQTQMHDQKSLEATRQRWGDILTRVAHHKLPMVSCLYLWAVDRIALVRELRSTYDRFLYKTIPTTRGINFSSSSSSSSSASPSASASIKSNGLASKEPWIHGRKIRRVIE